MIRIVLHRFQTYILSTRCTLNDVCKSPIDHRIIPADHSHHKPISKYIGLLVNLFVEYTFFYHGVRRNVRMLYQLISHIKGPD